MYWSNSKQRWLKLSEMHTSHLVNALRKGLNDVEKDILDEIVKRMDAKDNALAEATDTYVVTIRRQS